MTSYIDAYRIANEIIVGGNLIIAFLGSLECYKDGLPGGSSIGDSGKTSYAL